MDHEGSVVLEFRQIGLVVVIQVTDRIDIFKSFRLKNLCHVLREGVVSHVP